MGLFHRERRAPEAPAFPPEDWEPVIRCSICTGEQVACMRERATGRLREIMLLRSPDDLAAFRRDFGLEETELRRVY